MSKMGKIVGVIAIVGAIIFAPPIIYQKSIDKNLKQIKTNIEQKGAKLELKNDNSSYFRIDRTYILKVEKPSAIIKNFDFINNNSDKEQLAEIIKECEVLIKLNIVKYPISHKKAISVSINKIPSEIGVSKEQIDKIKKHLQLYVNLDSIGQIEKVKMKDIDLTLSEENSNAIFKNVIKNFYLEMLSNNKQHIHLTQFLNKIDNNSSYYPFVSNIKIDNFDFYNKNSNNDDITFQKLAIKNISFYNKDSDYTYKIKIENLKTDTDVISILNKISFKNNFSIQNIDIDIDGKKLIIKDWNYKLKLNQIDKKSFHTFIYSLNNTAVPQNEQVTEKALQTIINKGFKADLSFYINNISDKITSLDRIEGKIELDIKPNKVKLESKKILNYVDAEITLKTSYDNLLEIAKIFPQFINALPLLFQNKDGIMETHISIKNGKILINGKAIF